MSSRMPDRLRRLPSSLCGDDAAEGGVLRAIAALRSRYFLTCCGRLAQPARTVERAELSQVLRMIRSYQAQFAPMHARRPIRSFVLRAGRVTAAQERALDRAVADFRRGFRRRATRPRRALRAPRAALSGNRIRRGRSDRRAGEGPSGDRLSRHRGASSGRRTAVAAMRRRQRLANLRIVCHDAVEVLASAIADDSFDSILIFFPDPWHKKRHHKRRLIDTPLRGHARREAAAGRRAAAGDRLAGLCRADVGRGQCLRAARHR